MIERMATKSMFSAMIIIVQISLICCFLEKDSLQHYVYKNAIKTWFNYVLKFVESFLQKVYVSNLVQIQVKSIVDSQGNMAQATHIFRAKSEELLFFFNKTRNTFMFR